MSRVSFKKLLWQVSLLSRTKWRMTIVEIITKTNSRLDIIVYLFSFYFYNLNVIVRMWTFRSCSAINVWSINSYGTFKWCHTVYNMHIETRSLHHWDAVVNRFYTLRTLLRTCRKRNHTSIPLSLPFSRQKDIKHCLLWDRKSVV